MEPIRIYIGTEKLQWLATEVLKWSVKTRTHSPVEFIELKDLDLGLESKMYTGFSFYRFYIPEACGYKGKALYLDADIVVLADIHDLLTMEMNDKGVLARPGPHHIRYTSVMLLSCEKLTHWKIREWSMLINNQLADYGKTMFGEVGGLNYQDFGDLPDYWNHLDEADETTKILHYTHVPMQPWKRAGHPHASIFLKEMKSAIEGGFITTEQVQNEIAQGNVYPKILTDALNGKKSL